MELRGSDGDDSVPDPTARLLVVEVQETSQTSDTVVDLELGRRLLGRGRQASTAAARAPHEDSTERAALAVAGTATVDLTNLFFLLRGGDTVTEQRLRCWGWAAGGVPVLFAFAAFLSAAGLLLGLRLHTTAVVASAARWQVLLLASAAALFVASAGTVLLSLRDARGLRGGL